MKEKLNPVYRIRKCRRQRGAALVEFTISVSLLFLLMFGIIEVGLLFKNQATISQAAREASRSASLGSTTATCKARAVNTSAVTITTAAVTLDKSTDGGTTWSTLGDNAGVTANNGVAGNLVRATVTYASPLVSSYIFSGTTRTLTAKVVMNHE